MTGSYTLKMVSTYRDLNRETYYLLLKCGRTIQAFILLATLSHIAVHLRGITLQYAFLPHCTLHEADRSSRRTVEIPAAQVYAF